ncbi:MAG TPA: DUF6636 domain-containing protein [Rubellimicrobium sp.]|jgi:hypothetical protein|nr:DUF6636 domain-containing protein [Rubellimicrobium sp.]
MRGAFALAAVLLAGPAAADTLTSFHTPSGNIHCMGIEGADGTFVDCEILQRNDSSPLRSRPADCDLEWGDRFTVSSTGPASLACHGDTVQDPNGAVLPYGQAFRFGPIACSATEQGLTCQNASGHGFFLSRATQQLF